MADATLMARAKEIYGTLCDALDARKWKYSKDEEKLVAYFGVNGEDIPLQFIIFVDAERQLVRFMSPLPFKMCEDKRMEGAIATCVANYGMVDGSFDYNLADGAITFRMTASYRESEISDTLFQYMISCTCVTVDKYNDQFMALDKGAISIADFVAKG